jgi:chemotaxis methyl-accepting protein methylase
MLEQNIYPTIVARKPEGGEVRVWSAGCATGQEAYSIAIQLSEIIENNRKNLNVRIFATDISDKALDAARTGKYNSGEIQNVKIEYLNKYFVSSDETYTIIPRLRQRINFIKYDMLDLSSANPPESIYGDFDIVMCNNMLMYYESNAQRVIIDKIKQAVSPTGYLVTGEVEKKIVENDSMLKMISAYGPIFIK